MANSTIALTQETFQGNMLTLLKEGKGGKLVEFCESDRNVIGEKHTFYRMDASTTDTDVNYFTDLTGTAGDTSSVEVTPSFVYAKGFKKEKDLLLTNIDIKSSYMKSFKAAIDRAEDAAIIAAIVAQNANLTTAGDGATVLEEQFNTFVKSIAYAQALVKDNDDHGANVAVVINDKDYSKLFVSDKFTSSDHLSISDAGTMLAGGKFIVTKAVPEGTTYIVPKNTVCFASWKGGDKAVMKYSEEVDGYVIWARKSIGATVGALDAEAIIKFSSLVA